MYFLLCFCEISSVFWDVEDCPIPDGVDPDEICMSMLSQLLRIKGHVGEVSFSTYCDKNKIIDDFKLHHIPLVPAGDKSARLSKMITDIFDWALNNPVDYPQVTPM
ncbi:unnamed protein product [Thlaspi arvense]|uniref:NYN domain-containing protein n=1 Tax=Thlaspi arvense TaxID=13288 RepID=A0AAU9SKD4_THLAR|nr:unnamed protein product [Thlaspi arvense]